MLTRIVTPCLLAITLLACTTGCATAPSAASAPSTSPTAAWQPHPAPLASPTCARDLDAVVAHLRTLDTTALMAAKDGRVLLAYGPVEQVSIVFSVRKSILAMLYGKYVQQGTIDLRATLADLDIDDVGGLLPTERRATVDDLLRSRSGVFHAAANGGDDLAHASARGSHPPGAYFLYNNWDFNAAGTVFEQRTGRGIYDAFLSDIARPIQLQDFDPSRHKKMGDRAKSMHLAYPFYLSTRDMARIGQLMLRGGEWNGARVLDADWVQAITQRHTPSSDMHPPATARRKLGYGRMWWVTEPGAPAAFDGAYMAWGVHGQFILVLPRQNVVIAHKRRVPESGNWNVSWVRMKDFFKAAEMIAKARCDL